MATTNQSTVVAVFRNRSEAESAAADLKANGIPEKNVYIGSYSDTGDSSSNTRTWQETHQHEGGIKGWFKSLFGQDDAEASDSVYYENAANRGEVLLSLDVDDQNVDRVTSILQNHNPIDVGEETTKIGQQTTARAAASASPAPTSSTKTKSKDADLPKSIPVVEEDLQVGKRQILRGGVRVYSRVREQPVEETVRLREEHVRVERQPANRSVEAGDLQAGRDEVIEVQEFAEEPVVQKQARVVEEVRVSKDASERTETVRDTVRRREVNVENLGKGDTATAASTTKASGIDDDFRRDFQTRYASSGASYEDYGPAYEYGYQAASDPRYQGRSWDEVESDLRSDYGLRYPNSAWERMKASVRYGWDKITGRARGATSTR
ncbi:MAG: YsnF/AvaK domain-containing protein [Acidobacteriaceae bacterium]|nr:YsnF/AvaK domain-containing protein [Acidobacteriaceae bacterium]